MYEEGICRQSIPTLYPGLGLEVIQQLRGQNFAIYWPPPLRRQFLYKHFWPPLPPHLVHAVIAWPLTCQSRRKYAFIYLQVFLSKRQTFMIFHNLMWNYIRIWGRSQTTLTEFLLFLTTYPPALTFSMLWRLTESEHFWTTYLPCLVNIVCERPLWEIVFNAILISRNNDII